jgi:uncharacterized protein (TIGR03086 family)
MAEVIDRYTGLAEQFGQRVESAPDDAWDRPAPCEGWQARDVVAHVVASLRGITAAVQGGEVQPMGADEDPKEAWRTSFAAAKAAINEPGALEQKMEGPMGPMPLEFMLGRLLANDVLVHTWDLARAVGGDERLDQDAVGHAFEGLKPLDQMLRQPGVFGPKVEPPEGADLQTQFLCFLGRNP